MDLAALARGFGATAAEPVTLGASGARVVRLERGRDVLFWKSADGIDAEVVRLEWLAGTGVPCPAVLDRGDDWMLTTELAGRDAAQPWPADQRPAVLDALVEGIRVLHALDPAGCPFPSAYPPGAGPPVVTHGDYCCPNVVVDPETRRFAGVLDVGWLGVGSRYADLAMVVLTLGGTLNPQYGGMPAARRVVEAAGGDPDHPLIATYLDLDTSGYPPR